MTLRRDQQTLTQMASYLAIISVRHIQVIHYDREPCGPHQVQTASVIAYIPLIFFRFYSLYYAYILLTSGCLLLELGPRTRAAA